MRCARARSVVLVDSTRACRERTIGRFIRLGSTFAETQARVLGGSAWPPQTRLSSRHGRYTDHINNQA
eukprot:1062753-Pleurochrysis_carterae.AAC.1